jgi:hypothetical protein
LRIYCGCAPSSDVSLVDIFAAAKYIQIIIQSCDHIIEFCMQKMLKFYLLMK